MVVQLTAGTFNITGAGVTFSTSNCTLRGAGPGTGATGGNFTNDSLSNLKGGGTGTFLFKADRATNRNPGFLIVNNVNQAAFSTSINLATDATLGVYSVTLASNPGIKVGEIVLIDENTDNDPDVWWGVQQDPPGGSSRQWYSRQDRSLAQLMEVTAVNGNTITFATPFHHTYAVAYQAQLSRYAQPWLAGVGIEELTLIGGQGGWGNIAMTMCEYCWIKHVESYWSEGPAVNLNTVYRSELRDSYLHETPDPNPGGGGYLLSIDRASSDNLIENNIMWNGNKEIVMRGTGGGNVVAYNYMDDAFGANYPNLPEAGVNAGHYTTPHMELLEGNYSQNYKGDTYWGNSIDITVFRNDLSGIRAAHPPLNTYMSGCYPYGDYEGREAVDIQGYSYRHNLVGNVLGFNGQKLLSYNGSCYQATQDKFVFENLTTPPSDNPVVMWYMGDYQDMNQNWQWNSTTYQTQLRQGNWDWVTKTQTWLGIGGTQGSPNGSPQTIPNSLYLKSAPPFFGANTWPWVDPSTGTTYVLPAKARFDARTPNG
jgi:hypothetical protein